MDLIQIAWPMMGGACVILGLIHLVLWSRQRGDLLHLAFALTAFSVGSFSVTELLLMQARTPGAYADLLRWLHVPGAIMFVGLAVFVRLRFPASRTGLCALVCGLRLAALVANFTTGQNLNFLEVTGVHVTDLGAGFAGAVPEGRLNPWMVLGQLSNLLLVYFLVDAVLRTRKGANVAEFQAAVRICGSGAIFIVLTNSWHFGVVAGLIDAPDMLVPAFLCVVVIMSRELVGEVLRAGQLARDLSVSESRLVENERRMSVAVRAAEIGLWSWDAASAELWLSEMGRHILGIAPGESYQRDAFRMRLDGEDRGRIGRCYAQALQGDGEIRCEFQLQWPGGEWRWVLLRGQVHRSGPGAERTYGVVMDVTERRRQEDRFRLVLEASPIAKLLLAPGGVIALANPQAERIFLYSRDELLGMHAEQLIPAQLQSGELGLGQAHDVEAGARSAGLEPDLRALRKDGSMVPVEVVLTPIRINDQPYNLASVIDLSARRRLEAESALQREELAHLSRVALLAELSGSLAHELNQPLTAILSDAQAAIRFLAASPPNLAEVHESLVNIVESDKRGGEVIRRLRAMLRKEASDFRVLDLNDVVLDVLRIIRSDLLNRRTEIGLDLGSDLPAIIGDSIQLQQVLLNLIMNGCDAMAEVSHGRQLLVRTRPAGSGSVELVVSDLGRGIPEDQLERIFSPFVTSKKEGMGLGLAVCRTIIQAHHGRIWASRNPSRGASLHVLIPIADTGR